jgi:hypothetical protein
MAESINYGISGATNVSAQNLAMGPNARIDISEAAPELSSQLDALLRAIGSFQGSPANRAELAAAGDDVAEALAEPQPDKQRVLSRLSSIASAAGSATAIASAATMLANTVGAIL